VFTDNWNELTPEQRYEARMQAWFASEANIDFVSDEARNAWRERMQMLRDAIELKKPKRVPVLPNVDLLVPHLAGLTAHDAYYEFAKLEDVWLKFNAEYDHDAVASTFAIVFPGKLYDVVDLRLVSWPGHGTGDDVHFQYNEREWMHADEYDWLINDPSDFWLRGYLPRIFGSLEPAAMLPHLTDMVEPPVSGAMFFPFSLPPVRQMLQKLLDAGEAAAEWLQACATIDAKITATGKPSYIGGFSKAPYDIIGDTLRGTRGIMLDKFRQPDKLSAAMERLVPLAIEWGRSAADMSRQPVVMLPLHKGADGFLSDADFRKFYWPTLKAVLLGLIEEGIVPWLFAEGGYNSRLEAIHDPDIPPGRMVWMFDTTDMKEAKRHLGGYQCIAGNVPGSLLIAGTPEEVDAYVKQLINDVAGDGGFMLCPGIVVNDANPACLQAMIAAGKKYGAQV